MTKISTLLVLGKVVSLPISAAIMSKGSRTGMKFGGTLIKRLPAGTNFEEQIQSVYHSSCHSF